MTVIEVLDPWADRYDARRSRSVPLRAALAALLSTAGVALRLWGHGPDARRAAVVLVVAAALWQLLRHFGSPPAARAASMSALVAVTAWLVAPTVGRAPGLVVLAALLVADAALVSWRPIAAWPARCTTVAGLAVPLLAAAQVVWFRSGSPTWLLALLVSASAVVESYHRAPELMAAADRTVARVISGVGGALGALSLLLVAVPFFYLPAAIGRLLKIEAAQRRQHGATSNWRPASGAAARSLAAARLPFVAPDASVARRGHLRALAVVLVGSLVVGAVVLSTREGNERSHGPPDDAVERASPADQLDLLESVPYSRRPAMSDVAHADELQADLSRAVLVPHAATGYVTADTTSRYVNVRGGERSAAEPECATCPQVDLWLVGASSVFGVGQRDDHAIGSVLVRMAAERGIALNLSNLAAPGWTIHQEANWVRHRLAATERRPDLVVFLDGFNDVASAMGKQFSNESVDDGPLVFDEDDMVQALRSPDLLSEAQVDAAVDRAVRAYKSELDQISNELSSMGIPTRAFFQPDAFASERQLEVVRGMYGGTTPRVIDSGQLGAALDAAADRLADEVVDLRDVLDAVRAPVFLDVVHTNEEGARRVAGAIMETVGNLLGLVAEAE